MICFSKMLDMKKITYAVGCVLAITLSAKAQTTMKYTLDDCINEAVANNMKLRNADNQVLMSSEQRKEAYTQYFPTVNASGTGFAANQHLLKMGMGNMSLSLIKKGVMADVMVMQPLYAGGQIVNGNKLAKVGEEVSRLQRKTTVDEVKLNTETYFWQIVMLKEKLKTIDQVMVQVEYTQKDAEAAVQAGVRNRNDLLQVKLRRNEMRTSRIELENNLHVLTDLLAQYMGHAQDSIVVISPFEDIERERGNDIPTVGADIALRTSLKKAEIPTQFYISPSSALLQTNEYQLLRKQVDVQKLQYKMSVGKNMPSVAIGGGYIYNNLMDKSSNRLVGMLTVSVPISQWWGGSHSMKRQKLKAQNAENDLQDQSQLLVIRMKKAWNGMNDAYKQVNIALESIEQSEENLRLNTDYYKAGTATISDLLDAQTLYQQSHDKYVEAFTQYEVKKREYLQATGR